MKLNNNDDSHNSGLNLLIYNMLLDIESHPAWVCGLKLGFRLTEGIKLRSHPAWVCGLKQFSFVAPILLQRVTPCVGVWIETNFTPSAFNIAAVTPCVGVWIETYCFIFMVITLRHTLRGCVD